MTTRRAFVLTLSAALLASPIYVMGQAKDKVWKLGFLSPRRHLEPGEPDYYDEVPKRLAELGYVEGKNLVILWRYADGKYDQLQPMATELVALGADLIFVDGTTATLAAKKATSTVPIVFGSAGDPVGNKLVASLARPGGNVTGISLLAGESIVNKQLEMMMNLVPGLKSVGALHNPGNPYSRIVLASLQTAAQSVHVRVLPLEARSAAEIEHAFDTMASEKVDAFIWISDAVMFQEKCRIAELATKHRLPGMGQGSVYAACGGLIAYGSNQFDNYRRAAAMADRILKGEHPADLPVEQPMRLELAINKRTAAAIGVEIPTELLLLADKVID